MGWFSKEKKEPGWVVIGVDDAQVSVVHGLVANAGRPEIRQYAMGVADTEGLAHLAKEFALHRYDCATLLKAGDYQLVLVEAPNVPQQELKTAIRWRIKDVLDAHVDDVTLDVLDLPVPKDAAVRNHSMYAVAARNEVIQSCVKRFDEANVPLSVIDIPETAQRNIAALYEDEDRGLAMLHFSEAGGLLTINYRSELYLARRIDITAAQVAEPGERDSVFAQIQLELQRTFDHFERQFSWIALSRLMLGPEPGDSGLAAYLAGALGLPVRQVAMEEVLDLPQEGMGPDLQSKLFYLVGGALRRETAML
jgi:MSHA biogenesis protein MshI